MVQPDIVNEGPSRRWGGGEALFDEDEARRRLLEAAGRVIVSARTARVSMAEIADEAGVSRSTVYRYFPSRDDLVLELLVRRTARALEEVVASLPHPDDAEDSIPRLVLELISRVEGNPLNEALFSDDSQAFVAHLGLSSEPIIDVGEQHYGRLISTWQDDGQVHPDLDVRDAVRWFNAVSVLLLETPWRQRTSDENRRFLEQYLGRALLVSPAT